MSDTVDRGAVVAALTLLIGGLFPSPVGNIALVMVLAGWQSIVILILHFRGVGMWKSRDRLYWSLLLGTVVGGFALPMSYARYDSSADVPIVLISLSAYQLVLLLVFLGLGARLSGRALTHAAGFGLLCFVIGIAVA